MNERQLQTPTGKGRLPFHIAGWRIDPESGRVSKNGNTVKLEPKVMELLGYLAQRPARVISREELERAIWTGTVVGYDALTNAIIKLRKAFGDDPHHPWLIETVSKKGYRLIAPVAESGDLPLSNEESTKPVGRQRHFTIAIGSLLALAGLAVVWWWSDPLAWRASRVPTIAVLPFVNLAGDSRVAYFSDGVREDIITDLSKLSGLRVFARDSASSGNGQPGSVKAGAIELPGARYTLEGSVRRSGDDLRITVRLIDTETGVHLWAEGYNRRMQDLFAVQVDVTRNIVSALALILTEEEKEYVARRDTRSVEAYDLFLQGMARYLRYLRTENLSAREFFSRALELDKNFTRAHSALALTHTEDYRFSWSADTGISADAALHHAERAVALDARSSHAHWILGYVKLHVRRDHAAALKLSQRAIELDPNSANAYALMAITHVYQGEPRLAFPLVERAMQLDPDRTARYHAVLGLAHYFSGNYAKARIALERSLERNPALLLPQLYLAATLNRMGEHNEARWAADVIRTVHADYKLKTWAETQPFANRVQLRQLLDDLQRAGIN